uniref:Uncharacterized protein n=1 Tax=Tetranychus urticae TaxID=32264 RepID=T1KBZ4_TETUR
MEKRLIKVFSANVLCFMVKRIGKTRSTREEGKQERREKRKLFFFGKEILLSLDNHQLIWWAFSRWSVKKEVSILPSINPQ